MHTGNAYSSRNHFGGTTPFKIQVKFGIPIFQGEIDATTVDTWLNLLEGYFYVHGFSNKENIIFSLLNATPHIKD